MRSQLKQLVAQIEQQTGESIQQKDIAEATGLDENTISRWMSPKPFKRFETKIVVKLCIWLECELGDLLKMDQVNN